MENKIKAGMVVVRLLGGPKMTVKEVLGTRSVVCRFFVGDKLREGIYDTERLEIVFCQHNLDLKKRI